MSPAPDAVGIEYAKALVARKAQQLCRRSDFQASEQEDVQQELWLLVLPKLEQFDPCRARLETFLHCLLSWAVAMLLRSRRCRKRASGVQPLSLESASSGKQQELLCHTVSTADVARRLGTPVEDPLERLERAEAVKRALARMPARLRDICRRIACFSATATGRELGLSRYRIRKALVEARPYFRQAGLENG